MSNYIKGWISYFCLYAFIQDYLGLEEYTVFVRAHWVVVPCWVWVVFFILINIPFKKREE